VQPTIALFVGDWGHRGET